MISLSPVAEERAMWLAVTLASCAAVEILRYVFFSSSPTSNPEPTRCPSKREPPATQQTEDALKPETLEVLMRSYNYGIRETAAAIILDRALHDPKTIDLLLFEITRPDHDRREAGIRALHQLSEQVSTTKLLDNPKVYSGIVKSLEYCVTDVTHNPYDKDFDNFDFRDAAERRLLSVVYRLSSEYHMDGFIKAGFVGKWLAKEPWGETEKDIQEAFADLFEKTTMMSVILLRIGQSRLGRRELLKAKLVTKNHALFNDTIDVKMMHGEGTAGEGNILPEGDLRLRDLSAEERLIRIRHRNAMVLNDGVQPVDRSDIIEREIFSPVEERPQG